MLLDRTLALGRKFKNRAAARRSVPKVAAESLPRAKWEAELQEVERRLASDPGSVDLRFRRAFWLSELGRLADARNDYIKVLECEPRHQGALNNLASLLAAMGNRSAARLAYQEAVARHPDDYMSRVNLGNLLLHEIEHLEAYGRSEEVQRLRLEACEHYEEALRTKPGYELAHEGLCYLLRALGDEQKAAWHRQKAFQNRSIIPLPYRGAHAPIPVLLLVSTTGGNVKLQKFLDPCVFQTSIVLPEFYDRKTPLPPHQLVVNAIGDTEVSSEALAAAESVLALTTAPVINPPTAVLATGRGDNAKRFSGLAGIVTPIIATLPREQLSGADAANILARHGFAFPLLLRTPGFHTGLNFLRVENFAALPAALAELPGRELIVMQYLDGKGPDGKVRKYRVMLIDGRIYPLHVAVSSHWKIHLFTAETADKPEYRAEDAALLKDMRGVLGSVAMNALERIQSMLGLDYGGIDFGLNAKGEVLLFEANATMVVNPPESDPRWNYRLPAYQRIEQAVQNMFRDKASSRRRASPQVSQQEWLMPGKVPAQELVVAATTG
jgi:Tfp pilus assembly protein PilF/glutathione synthase/RimK-type ligase-like ATP-grasp enzyme